ncbi:MAG: hypothetical protein HY537_12785 [Deltaproteobacteria bacterium]|nr:hypothetical protein [Deltaproteobacteria bacterium]
MIVQRRFGRHAIYFPVLMFLLFASSGYSDSSQPKHEHNKKRLGNSCIIGNGGAIHHGLTHAYRNAFRSTLGRVLLMNALAQSLAKSGATTNDARRDAYQKSVKEVGKAKATEDGVLSRAGVPAADKEAASNALSAYVNTDPSKNEGLGLMNEDNAFLVSQLGLLGQTNEPDTDRQLSINMDVNYPDILAANDLERAVTSSKNPESFSADENHPLPSKSAASSGGPSSGSGEVGRTPAAIADLGRGASNESSVRSGADRKEEGSPTEKVGVQEQSELSIAEGEQASAGEMETEDFSENEEEDIPPDESSSVGSADRPGLDDTVKPKSLFKLIYKKIFPKRFRSARKPSLEAAVGMPFTWAFLALGLCLLMWVAYRSDLNRRILELKRQQSQLVTKFSEMRPVIIQAVEIFINPYSGGSSPKQRHKISKDLLVKHYRIVPLTFQNRERFVMIQRCENGRILPVGFVLAGSIANGELIGRSGSAECFELKEDNQWVSTVKPEGYLLTNKEMIALSDREWHIFNNYFSKSVA